MKQYNKVYTPIIILGAPRSGTNMLRDILTRIENFSTWSCDEINPIWHHNNLKHPDDELRPAHVNLEIESFIRSQFQKIAQKFDSEFVVEKTCANCLRPEFVNKILPDAKFIFIYRDGRDAVASALKRWYSNLDLKYTVNKAKYVPIKDFPFYFKDFIKKRAKQFISKEKRIPSWGPKYKNMERDLRTYPIHVVAARQWSRSVNKSLEFFDSIDSRRYISLSYEDFVDSPELYLKKILNFLAYSNSDVLNYKELTKTVSNKSMGKWKQDLTKIQKSEIEKEIEIPLKKLGYDL